MSLTVFTAQEIAEKCFLSEALLWVAVNRFPLAYEIVDEECDAREYEKNYEGPEPFIPDESPLSAEECISAGLPPNPEREDFETGNFHPDPEKIKKDLEYAKSRPVGDPSRSVFHDQKWLDTMEKSLVESEKFHARQTAWNADYD